MTPKTFRLFIKPSCGWCVDAEDWLKSRGWDYERLDVTNDRAARHEMIELTGQSRAPCAEIDGHVIADFDTGQLEHFLKQHGYAI